MIFSRLVPWLVSINLILSIILLLIVQPKQQTAEIKIEREQAALFNSWEYISEQLKQISVWGEYKGDLLFALNKEQRAGYFTYEIDTTVKNPDKYASSGGYVTFYNKICDRLIYREVSFQCKGTNFEGRPDIGIRLTVDDPNATPQNKERVTYELSSLNAYLKGKKSINQFWQTFTIDIGDFDMKRAELPLPRGIDKNTINKIVFFVNSETVVNCQEGTLWFRDIIFTD